MVEPGLYRISDDIKNFVFRVRLRRLHVTRQKPESNNTDCQFLDIRWQEKHFSQAEEGSYANDMNCITNVEKNYHKSILKIRQQGGRQNDRIFTYTNADIINNDTNNRLTEKNCLIINGTMIDTKLKHYSIMDKDDQSIITKGRTKLPNTDGDETMYIMADLNNTPDQADENIICKLSISCDGVLAILPPPIDENTIWTRIENKQREVFEYQVENISECIDQYSKSNQDQLTIKTLQLSTPSLSGSWLKNRSFELLVHGSIVSASGFTSDNLYICVNFVPKQDWYISDTSTVMTQICSCNNGIAYFSCPMECNFVCDNNKVINELCGSITIQVCSIDRWDRHITRGYGTTSIPCQPGLHSLNVATWKPSPKYVIEKLKYFFIGGSPELNDSYITGDYYNSRYGFHTDSSGTVQMYISTVHNYSYKAYDEQN